MILMSFLFTLVPLQPTVRGLNCSVIEKLIKATDFHRDRIEDHGQNQNLITL